MKKFTYSKQNIDSSDIKKVIHALKSELITQGKGIANFEQNLSKELGAKYCTLVSNGTAALHLSGYALNWNKNDIIITSPISFVASSNAAIYHGAIPLFVDIDENTYTLDCNKLEDKIKKLRKKNKKVKTVIGVDYAGHPCDWSSLKNLSRKYEFTLINDNCHSLGAQYKNSKHYGVKYADIVTQSFHAVKNITTGEGGAIITNKAKINNLIKSLRSHGIVKNTSILKKFGPWYYEMQNLGFNYRITDFQAALGNSQLKRLNNIISKKNKIAKIYNKIFKNFDLFKIPTVMDSCKHAYHLYPIQFDFNKSKINKKILFNLLAKKNIFPQVHYIPIYRQPYYKKKFNYNKDEFRNSEKFYKNVFSLPIYPSLSFNDIDYITKSILNITLYK